MAEAEAVKEPTEVQEKESDRPGPWMEDGNIVLAAEEKYFRVHRSILSANSEVFKDMFECLEPSEGEAEVIEQCPVVRLHDEATDVEMVLKAMYDRSYPIPYYEKMPFPHVSAFLRLGEKYNIRQLLHEAKARLSCAFGSTLDVAARISSSRNGTLQLFPRIADNDPYNFQIMNLLQEMDLQAPLPLAMYQCVVTCPLKCVLDGYGSKGTVYLLSQQNQRSFFLMKDILEAHRNRLVQCLRVSNNCVVRSSCVMQIPRIWSGDLAVGQPLGAWKPEWDKLFCEACLSDLKAWRDVEIQKTWKQIPTAFDFKSWDDVLESGDFPCAPPVQKVRPFGFHII